MFKLLSAVAAASLLAVPSTAALITYDIAWTGAGGYSMTGQFSFDSSAGTEVRDAEVQSLSINVFLNGGSIGTWTLANSANASFNFNFNAASGSFFTGGGSGTDTGQSWNYGGSLQAGTVGFGSGSGAQAVSASAVVSLGFQSDLSALKATLAQPATPSATGPVPEPATWTMMLGGFGLIGAAMRHRRAASIRFV